MTRAQLAALFLCAGAALPSAAHADPRLDEVVYSPWVQNGVLEVESRVGRLSGGANAGAATTVEEIEYGVNDRVSVAVLGAIERPAGGSSRLDSVGLESVIYLGQIPKVGVDAAAYVEYRHGLVGEPSAAEAKLLLGKQAGRFEGLFNLILERPIGPHNDEHFASWGYAASATWRTWRQLRLGAEAFGDFGDDHAFLGRQGAWVGPQVKWETKPKFLPVEVDVDAGWLAAVGQSRRDANNQLKLDIEFERRF
jgi:hypothetical protein